MMDGYSNIAPHIEEQNLYKLADLAIKAAREAATKKALACSAPPKVIFTEPIPACFGNRWRDLFTNRRDNFLNDNGVNSEDVMFVSLRFFEYAKWNAWFFMDHLFSKAPKPIRHGLPNGPNEYVEEHGLIDTLMGTLGDLDIPALMTSGLRLGSRPPDWEIARALSIAWFFDAAELHANGDKRAFDVLCDSAEAESTSSGYWMYEEGQKNATEKNPASEMAKRRHAENYALANEAAQYWREKIDPAISAAQAANTLLGVVPLSHKRLSEIVSAEKKKRP